MKLILIILLIGLVLISGCNSWQCENDEFLKRYDIIKGGGLSETELFSHGLTGAQIMEVRDYCNPFIK